jgi:hypothetical protein
MPPLVVETVRSLEEFVGREIAVTDWLTRVALWHNDCARFLDAFPFESFHEAGHPVQRRRPHGDQLRLESGPLSLSCSRGLRNSRARGACVLEGAARRARGGIFRNVGGSRFGEALLCRGMDYPLLP